MEHVQAELGNSRIGNLLNYWVFVKFLNWIKIQYKQIETNLEDALKLIILSNKEEKVIISLKLQRATGTFTSTAAQPYLVVPEGPVHQRRSTETQGPWPQPLLHWKVTFIPKPQPDQVDVRPIAVGPMIYRLWSSLRLKHVQPSLDYSAGPTGGAQMRRIYSCLWMWHMTLSRTHTARLWTSKLLIVAIIICAEICFANLRHLDIFRFP